MTSEIRNLDFRSFAFERYSIEGINPGNWPVPFLKCDFRNCKGSDEQTEKQKCDRRDRQVLQRPRFRLYPQESGRNRKTSFILHLHKNG